MWEFLFVQQDESGPPWPLLGHWHALANGHEQPWHFLWLRGSSECDCLLCLSPSLSLSCSVLHPENCMTQLVAVFSLWGLELDAKWNRALQSPTGPSQSEPTLLSSREQETNVLFSSLWDLGVGCYYKKRADWHRMPAPHLYYPIKSTLNFLMNTRVFTLSTN